jgi:hypothetical protein
VKTLKILGIAAVLVLFSGAVAFAAEQVLDETDTATDPVAEETEGRFCNENTVRTNEGDGEQVRTHTRTRTAWEESAAECDGEQPKVRAQDRSSWSEDDESTRELTQTRIEGDPQKSEPAAPTAGGGGPGDGSSD